MSKTNKTEDYSEILKEFNKKYVDGDNEGDFGMWKKLSDEVGRNYLVSLPIVKNEYENS